MVWWKLPAEDTESPVGRYVLGMRSAKDWANYGRWVELRGYLASSDRCAIDHTDPRAMDALGYRLGLNKKQLQAFVQLLLDAGAINKDEYADGFIVVDDVFEQWCAYENRKAINKANRNAKR